MFQLQHPPTARQQTDDDRREREAAGQRRYRQESKWRGEVREPQPRASLVGHVEDQASLTPSPSCLRRGELYELVEGLEVSWE